jgi:hypothetical protein
LTIQKWFNNVTRKNGEEKGKPWDWTIFTIAWIAKVFSSWTSLKN